MEEEGVSPEQQLRMLQKDHHSATQHARARADALHRLGFNVTAIAHGGKGPRYKWKASYPQRQRAQDVERLPWDGFVTKDEQIVSPATAVGIIHGTDGCGDVRAFDIDAASDEHGKIPVSEEIANQTCATPGVPPDTPWLRRSTSGTGWHLFFICPDDLPDGVLVESGKEKGVFVGLPHLPGTFDHLELRWAGCQTLFNGEVPATPPPTVPIARVVAAFHSIAKPPLPAPSPVSPAHPRRAAAPTNGDPLKEEIRQCLDILHVAQHFFGNATEPAGGDEVRILGNGGLLVNTAKQTWYCHTAQMGGDVFDLVCYAFHHTTLDGHGEYFQQVLHVAAALAGIALPEHVPRRATGRSPPNTPPQNGTHSDPPDDTGLPPDSHRTDRTNGRRAPSGRATGTTPHTGLPPDRFSLIHADKMEDLPDLDWLIEGLLPLGIVAQLFGAPGEGKSHLLLDLALTVAQHYPVVYLAAEDELQYKPRLRAWCQHHAVGRGHLHFWIAPLNLFNPAAIAHFLCEVAPIEPALIILDPLAQCGAGNDLDNTRDMTLAVEGLHTIRKATGATVLVCHHTGWSGDHERGSSVLRGATRVVYKLTNDDGLLKMSCEKMNNAPKPDPRYFRLMEQDESVVLMPASRIVMENTRPSEKQIQILESLQLETLREASFAQLLEYTEQRKSTLHHSLSRLIKQRYVEEIPSQSRKLYRLTAAGRGVLEEHNAAPDESGAPSGPVGLNWAVRSGVVRPAPVAAGASYTPPESHTTPEETKSCPVVRCESGGSPVVVPEVQSGAPPYRGAGLRTGPDNETHRTPGETCSIEAKVAASKTVQRAVEPVAARAFEHALACVDDAPAHLRDEVQTRILFLIRLMGDDDHPEGWEWRSTYLLERQRDGYRTSVDVDRTRVVMAALRVELTEAEQARHFDAQSP